MIAAQETSPLCPECGGTGYRPIPEKPGVVGLCLQCRKSAEPENLVRKAHIPRRYEDCTFNNFHRTGITASQSRAWDVAWSFFFDYPNPSNSGLLFMGSCGTGKTHLAVAIAHSLMSEKRIPCLFWDCRELLQALRNSYDPQSAESFQSVIRPALETEVLVLDDLGADTLSGFVLDTFNHLLNNRYMNRKMTLITTNYLDPLRELKEAGEGALSKSDEKLLFPEGKKPDGLILVDRIGVRLRSRLYEMCRRVPVVGEDYRKKHGRLF